MYTLCASQVAVVCTYVHITCTCTCIASLRPKKGTRTVPFLRIPAGIVISSTGRRSPMYKVYIVPGDTTGRSPLRPAKGTRTVPFFNQPRGASYLVDLAKKQDRITGYFWTQGPLYCKYFSRPPVASYSNPKKSQSRRLLHSCIVLCVLAYVLCFLGALARGLFLKKTHSG